jgi:hypothetical protein
MERKMILIYASRVLVAGEAFVVDSRLPYLISVANFRVSSLVYVEGWLGGYLPY